MSDASKSSLVRQRHVRARSWQVTLILTLFFISVAGAAGIGWWYARESPPHQGPIVLITVDGLAAGEAVPGAPTETPDASAIAALAHDSLVFDRAYAHSSELLPTQVSMLAGQLPLEHGVRDDAGFVVRPDTLTLPELLRNRGFATGGSVSSFLLREDTGIAKGFSMYASAEADPAPDATLSAGGVGERAIESAATWAAKQNSQRYFLMLEVDAAHAESAVCTLTALLRDRHLYDGATIVLVGDRGRIDGALNEQTLHVPMMVKQPQREGAGRHVATTVQHIDLLPTILDLVRAPVPADLGGRSLKPLLTDTAGHIVSRPVYSESLAAVYRFGGQPAFALTLPDVRYVRRQSEALVHLAQPGAAVPSDAESDASSSGELPPMQATLARMLADRPLPRALPVPIRDRDRLASEGVLAGLQTSGDDTELTNEQQDSIAATQREAARQLGLGRPAQALRLLDQIVKAHPTLASVHYQIGSITSEFGRVEDAIAAYKTAASLRPEAPEASRALATVLLRAGKLPAADDQITAAIEASSRFGATEIAASHEVAARIALARHNADAALRHADAVQNAAPAMPMRAFVQGQLLAANGDTEEASRVLRGAAAMLRQHDATLEGLQLALGRTLMALDQREDAEAAFRAELTSFPRNAAAYTEVVQVLHDMDRDDEAGKVVTSLLTASPTPEGYATAAKLWTLLGETARAAEVRSDARARFPLESAPARLARVKPR